MEKDKNGENVPNRSGTMSMMKKAVEADSVLFNALRGKTFNSILLEFLPGRSQRPLIEVLWHNDILYGIHYQYSLSKRYANKKGRTCSGTYGKK